MKGAAWGGECPCSEEEQGKREPELRPPPPSGLKSRSLQPSDRHLTLRGTCPAPSSSQGPERPDSCPWTAPFAKSRVLLCRRRTSSGARCLRLEEPRTLVGVGGGKVTSGLKKAPRGPFPLCAHGGIKRDGGAKYFRKCLPWPQNTQLLCACSASAGSVVKNPYLPTQETWV